MACLGYCEGGPPSPRDGALLMLQCFFDDSGTHDGSKVVVWGGVAGTVEQFEELEQQWVAALANPPFGKPPIKKFSQSDCRACHGEFKGYNRAESDHLQYIFREIVINSNVVGVCYGVDVAAWDRHVTGRLREFIGGAESAAFGLCAKKAFEIADLNEDKISMVFDQGRKTDLLQILYSAAGQHFPEAAKNAASTFMPVASTPGLQAADLIANYFYAYAKEYLLDSEAEADPHLLSLLANSQVVDGLMGEAQIDFMAQAMRHKNDWLRDD